uniref:Zinc finger homeobox 2 n=1 Tax=Meleagris gallopavo TaxID=9103 RepID=A0A803YRA7_MELGA
MLDHIAHEVGLKKRVVQVWFQNTRARERKGQFRAVGPAQAHRRCPFCRALFKAKTALEAHIRSRHCLADPCSPSPGASGSASKSGESGDRPGQKRFRTQMTNLQLKVLKSCFNDYRTPTMLECEVLGNDIGLPKRVVQVWFQNARAKEKKSKLSMAKHFGINQTSYEGPKTECTLCGIKYSARLGCLLPLLHRCHPKDVSASELPAFPWQTSLRTSGDPYSSCLSPGLLSLQRYPRK